MSETVAVMQPYFLPYLGYFHLLNAVDTFVVHDKVKYTKKGWINRNRLVYAENIEYITLPLKKDHDTKYIDQRYISEEWQKQKEKHQRKVRQHYSNRDNFSSAMNLFKKLSDYDDLNLFNFIFSSIKCIAQELDLQTKIVRSSDLGDFSCVVGAEKVKAICRAAKATKYINAVGGQKLYDRTDFETAGIEINFIQSKTIPYDQKREIFIPDLSILDFLMSVSTIEDRKKYLRSYELI
tara:strand:+ start:178 stop:888 length:711 start_codon:yes stop_codon:yes gene_type:complete